MFFRISEILCSEVKKNIRKFGASKNLYIMVTNEQSKESYSGRFKDYSARKEKSGEQLKKKVMK